MNYGSTTEATDLAPLDRKSRLIRAVFWFVPSANPDLEHLFPLVRKWLVEVDDEGNAQREVGLSADGTPLFAAPDERNCGFWTDSDKRFAPAELVDLSAEQFEAAWTLARTMPDNAPRATREDALTRAR
jgi:hypothetical protein